ncbi:hypothetical protein [Halorarius halobius]|uniref:hypothetical protein n=1 Tax=Halorarius halobius TaxID=2962671 RepID=UPI0020CD24F1|nr:hypothetical protein [Halorarius halobius]
MATGYDSPRPFRYDAGVDHREVGHRQHDVGEPCPGRPVERPETASDGPSAGANHDT